MRQACRLTGPGPCIAEVLCPSKAGVFEPGQEACTVLGLGTRVKRTSGQKREAACRSPVGIQELCRWVCPIISTASFLGSPRRKHGLVMLKDSCPSQTVALYRTPLQGACRRLPNESLRHVISSGYQSCFGDTENVRSPVGGVAP